MDCVGKVGGSVCGGYASVLYAIGDADGRFRAICHYMLYVIFGRKVG